MALLAGKKDEAALYEHKADTIKNLVENKLWSCETRILRNLSYRFIS